MLRLIIILIVTVAPAAGVWLIAVRLGILFG